jgi:hypothetical protein
MTFSVIKRVCLAIGIHRETQKQVVRIWVEDMPVIEMDDVHIQIKLGKKQGSVSRRFHLHPLEEADKRNEVQKGPFVFRERITFDDDAKRFSPDHSVILLKYTHEYCEPGYENELQLELLNSLQQSMRAGASFLLDCIDQIQSISAGVTN